MLNRHAISDADWDRIEVLLPGRPRADPDRGGHAAAPKAQRVGVPEQMHRRPPSWGDGTKVVYGVNGYSRSSSYSPFGCFHTARRVRHQTRESGYGNRVREWP